MKTKVINFLGCSGSGKSLMAALVFSELKMRHFNAEYVPEFAKSLVWRGATDELNNQYEVSTQQYRMLKAVQGSVEYIVTDSPLIIGGFYNRYNRDNVSNIEKTEKMILSKMYEFDNIYIFLDRNPEFPYEEAGRLQDLEEAKNIDVLMKKFLDNLGIKYITVVSCRQNLEIILNHVLI
jgi:hypothetical protein